MPIIAILRAVLVEQMQLPACSMPRALLKVQFYRRFAQYNPRIEAWKHVILVLHSNTYLYVRSALLPPPPTFYLCIFYPLPMPA